MPIQYIAIIKMPQYSSKTWRLHFIFISGLTKICTLWTCIQVWNGGKREIHCKIVFFLFWGSTIKGKINPTGIHVEEVKTDTGVNFLSGVSSLGFQAVSNTTPLWNRSLKSYPIPSKFTMMLWMKPEFHVYIIPFLLSTSYWWQSQSNNDNFTPCLHQVCIQSTSHWTLLYISSQAIIVSVSLRTACVLFDEYVNTTQVYA